MRGFPFSMSFFKNLFLALTKQERIIFAVCASVAIVSSVVVMTLFIGQVTKAIAAPGGSYSLGTVGQPEYVNPVTAQSETDLSLVKLIYANIPDIADSISSSTDGLTWTVHLKSGLAWQDGQQLTSDDVIFTVQSIQNPDADSPLATAWQGVTVNRVSELELTFTLANPYVFFGDDLANLYILPKHIFADIPPGNWHLSDYNLKPIGSGPYEFQSYDESSEGFISNYRLSMWNKYPGQNGASSTQPNIQNINVSFFRNTNDLLAAFNSGAIDGFGDATPGELATTNGGIARPYQVYAWPTPSYYAVFWNTSVDLALQDAKVRQALSLAIDRDTLVSSTLAGYGAVDYGPIPPDAQYFSSSTITSPDTSSSPLAAASALLTQDGWTVGNTSSGPTAFRSKTIQKTTVPLAVTLTVPDIDYLVATAEQLQSTWQSIGVQVTIATDTPANIVANNIKNRTYEGLLFGNVLGPSSDLYSFWDSSQRFSPGLNLAIYDNPHVDRFIEGARQNLSNASRTIDYVGAQDDIVADNPAVFLYSPDYLFVSGRTIGGANSSLLITPSDISREMVGWYLNTTRVVQ